MRLDNFIRAYDYAAIQVCLVGGHIRMIAFKKRNGWVSKQ